MARVSSANMTGKDPTEWVVGARAARAARKTVCSQLTELILNSDSTGSRELVARRVGEYAEATRHGDLVAERAALMELAAAAGSTAAGVDLRRPVA